MRQGAALRRSATLRQGAALWQGAMADECASAAAVRGCPAAAVPVAAARPPCQAPFPPGCLPPTLGASLLAACRTRKAPSPPVPLCVLRIGRVAWISANPPRDALVRAVRVLQIPGIAPVWLGIALHVLRFGEVARSCPCGGRLIAGQFFPAHRMRLSVRLLPAGSYSTKWHSEEEADRIGVESIRLAGEARLARAKLPIRRAPKGLCCPGASGFRLGRRVAGSNEPFVRWPPLVRCGWGTRVAIATWNKGRHRHVEQGPPSSRLTTKPWAARNPWGHEGYRRHVRQTQSRVVCVL